MKTRILSAILSAIAAVILSGWLAANADDLSRAVPRAPIPTVSTAEIARQGFFYVGGHYVGTPGNETMEGAMYVEVMVPKRVRHHYPILFLCGGAGETGLTVMQTPDGRPGWAYYFVNQGYTVYIADYPGRGRSLYSLGPNGRYNPPRLAPLMEEVWSGGRSPASDWSKELHVREHRDQELADWPQWRKHTQWPGDGPNKGKMGDPVFDAFAKTEVLSIIAPEMVKATTDDMVQLVDMIGQPVILVIHSGGAIAGWLLADARPQLVKGIIAPEPIAPPIEDAERGSTGPGRLWGLTDTFIHYDPPVTDPSELQPVREEKADGPGLVPCWLQKEPAHRLINLEAIPVLNVSGEASYHRPYARCIAKWLNQAGVKTTYKDLEDVDLPGNGHLMMLEKNSDGIAKYFEGWIEKNVH